MSFKGTYCRTVWTFPGIFLVHAYATYMNITATFAHAMKSYDTRKIMAESNNPLGSPKEQRLLQLLEDLSTTSVIPLALNVTLVRLLLIQLRYRLLLVLSYRLS